MKILFRIFQLTLLMVYCLTWIAMQASFILLALISAGPLALLANALSFVFRGHFITEIEMLKMEHVLEGTFHYLEWVVPDRILGR